MKVKIEVDLTPTEARTFFGLPDVTPVNDALVNRMKNRVEKGINSDDVDGFIRAMFSGAGTGITEMQKTLWNVVKTAVPTSKDKEDA